MPGNPSRACKVTHLKIKNDNDFFFFNEQFVKSLVTSSHFKCDLENKTRKWKGSLSIKQFLVARFPSQNLNTCFPREETRSPGSVCAAGNLCSLVSPSTLHIPALSLASRSFNF